MTTGQRLRGTVEIRFGPRPAAGSQAVVRAALAEILGVPAGLIPLDRDPFGRPIVRGRSEIRVSVSHSGALVVAAVTVGRAIGVDCESVRDGPWHHLPRHSLTTRELAALQRLPAPARCRSFLRTWVRKEALSKAVGAGLALDPRTIELSEPGSEPRILSLPSLFGDASGWSVVDLEIDGHFVAVAVEDAVPEIIVAPATGS